MYYLQSRYYNPEWGRFISVDIIAGTVGEILGHNVFIYCKNDPINMSDETGFRPKFNNPFQRETPEMERFSIDVDSKWRKNSWYPKARSKRKSNSKISKYVKKPTKYIVGRTFKLIKHNKVTIGTSIVGGGIGAAKGAAKKTAFHNSKKLIRIDKMKNMFKYGTATSASFGGVKSGIVDFLFDTEEWFDETRIGKYINEQLDYTEQRIYIFIGD